MALNFAGRLTAAALLAALAMPAAAQKFSNTYTFLKAVRERDGAKVQEVLADPGSTAINSKDAATGEGGLHIVVRARDAGWLIFLLQKGARPDIQDKAGETPLGLAARIGWTEGAAQLIARRAPVDQQNAKGETPLIIAVQRRDLAMVRMLMAQGANPSKTDNIAGYSAIDYAKGDVRAAAILKLLEAPTAPKKAIAGPTL